MANINFPTRTPVGVIAPNQTVPPEGSIVIRVNPVVGTGANGGSTNQRGFPDITQMVDTNGFASTGYATLFPVSDMAFGAATSQNSIPMKLTKSMPAYNSGTGLPSYYDLVFDPQPGTPPSATAKLDPMQHYEFMLKATLPVIWLTMPNLQDVS